MKQSLQLRLGQQITMTPQLQQAIKLLQLSTLELHMEVQQALESNIMLETTEELDDEYREESNESSEEKVEATDSEELNGHEEDSFLSSDSSEEIKLDEATDIPEELDVDSGWEDTYGELLNNYDYTTPSSATHRDDDDARDPFNQKIVEESLQDHLRWQLDLTPFSDIDKAIAMAIIDSIDNDGYLKASLEDIATSLDVSDLDDGTTVEIDEIEAVLHRIQRFDPVGVAARDLAECLMLQLDELDEETPWLEKARTLVTEHLSLLAAHDYTQLTKRMKLAREDLQAVIDLIQSLNPRPGAQLATHQPTYIVPDVFVRKVKGQWKVELNQDVSPKLRINPHYASLVSSCRKESDVSSLKSHLQEARWFIKSLKSRHETLIKVSNCIVQRQRDFLEYGDEAMKPLVLHDIAKELEMHESTISRVTTQKYIHTSRGIYELKYFFSSHVSMDNGGECSSIAIRALIKKLIANENVAKPLSDSKIADLLASRGIKVARRTVAKYREAMAIPPSNERKRLK